jgi:hypothetical protein
MNECFPPADLDALGESTITGFNDRISLIPKDMCAPFYEAAALLETELLMIHKFVVLCVKHEDDLDVVANRWEWMAKMCDKSCKALNSLSAQHPDCGADYYQDRILDLRAKCLRLSKMHS